MGGPGQEALIARQGANTGLASQNAWQSLQSNPKIAQLMSQYQSGHMSLQDAMSAADQVNNPGVKGGGVDTSSIDDQIASLRSQMAGIGKEQGSAAPLPGGLAGGFASRMFGGGSSSILNHDQNMRNQLQDQIDTLSAQRQSTLSMAPQAAMDALALGVGTGSRLATDQVMANPLYRGLFNEGGLKDQAMSNYSQYSKDIQGIQGNLDEDRTALMGRDQSYGLQASDLAAYGQASDKIGRQYAAQGQNLAQMLSDRGLGSGANGVAAQSFSGLAGNQNEQLANAQFNIAQNRIQTAMGLAQARTQADLSRLGTTGGLQQNAGSLSLGLGNLGKDATSNQFNQNLAAINARAALAGNTAQMGQSQNAQTQNTTNEAFNQEVSTRPPSFMSQIAPLIGAGAQIGAAALTGRPPKV